MMIIQVGFFLKFNIRLTPAQARETKIHMIQDIQRNDIA